MAATIDVASSGKDVPMATNVRPITSLLTPRDFAMFTAPLTRLSEPRTMPTRPPTIQNMLNATEGSFSSFTTLSASSESSSAIWFSFLPIM